MGQGGIPKDGVEAFRPIAEREAQKKRTRAARQKRIDEKAADKALKALEEAVDKELKNLDKAAADRSQQAKEEEIPEARGKPAVTRDRRSSPAEGEEMESGLIKPERKAGEKRALVGRGEEERPAKKCRSE